MSASRLVSLLCCATALLCGNAMAQTPRVVKVAVKIASAQFNDAMSDEHRRKIESDVAIALTAELSRFYPILDWRTDLQGAEPVATWTAVMTQESSNSPDPEVTVEWRATTRIGNHEMPGLPKIQLYKEDIAFRPVGVPAQLQRDLTKATVGWVTSDANWKLFKDLFLSHVVIADKVIAEGAPLVVVPLPYASVKMASNSVLRVLYRGGAAGPHQKEITLTGISPHLLDGFGNTETLVEGCESVRPDDSPQQKWTRCAAPLKANPAQTISVYAADYQYASNADVGDDGLIRAP